MIYFNKIFKFPSPKDVGMSEYHNGMPIDLFNDDDRPTWSDYYTKMKHDYPVKFFFASTLPTFIRDTWFHLIGWQLRDFKWWFKSFIIRRDHLLDLRQPMIDKSSGGYYRHGYLEPDQKMLYAMFNILNEFVGESLNDVMYCPTEKDVREDEHGGMKEQLDRYFEIIAIHRWWNIDRLAEYKAYSDALRTWSEAKKAKSPDAERLFKELNAMEQANEATLDDMIARLMKVRRSMWS